MKGQGGDRVRADTDFVKKAAARQWKSNLPLWISAAAASSILVCVAMCLAFQEKGWHIVLIFLCAGIALLYIGKKTVCPDSLNEEILKEMGAAQEQIRSVVRYQMAWLYMVSVPAGVAMGLLVRPFLPWA